MSKPGLAEKKMMAWFGGDMPEEKVTKRKNADVSEWGSSGYIPVLPKPADAGPRQVTNEQGIRYVKAWTIERAGENVAFYMNAIEFLIAKFAPEMLRVGNGIAAVQQLMRRPPVPQEAAPRPINHNCTDVLPATAPDEAMRVAAKLMITMPNGTLAQWAALIRQAGSERERGLRTTLQMHWLAQIECNHYEQNDSAICACGWKSDRGFNVGKAVEFWIDHVWAEASRLLGGE